MRILIAIVVLILGIAAAAFATRPGPAEFDAMLDKAIREKVANSDIGENDNAFGTIALIGCKLRPSDCVQLARESLDLRFQDHTLYTRVTAEAFGRKVRCVGAFGRFRCDKPPVE